MLHVNQTHLGLFSCIGPAGLGPPSPYIWVSLPFGRRMGQPACALRAAAGGGFPWPWPDGHVRISAALPVRSCKGQSVPLLFPIFLQKLLSAQSLVFSFSFFGCWPPPGMVQSITYTGGNSQGPSFMTPVYSSINANVLCLPHLVVLQLGVIFDEWQATFFLL